MGNERLNQWIERNEKWKKYIAQGISRPTAVGHRPHSGPTRRTTPPKSPVARPRGPPRRVICIQYRTSRTHSADIFHPVCRTGFTAPIRTTTRGRRTTQISTSRTHNTTLPARPRLSHSRTDSSGQISKRLSPSPRVRLRGNEHVSNIKPQHRPLKLCGALAQPQFHPLQIGETPKSTTASASASASASSAAAAAAAAISR